MILAYRTFEEARLSKEITALASAEILLVIWINNVRFACVNYIDTVILCSLNIMH